MQNVFLKPGVDASGAPLFVRDPQSGKPLDASGEWKPRDAFWLHRLRDKDVIEATPPERSAKVPSSKPPLEPKSRPSAAD